MNSALKSGVMYLNPRKLDYLCVMAYVSHLPEGKIEPVTSFVQKTREKI